MKNFLLGLVGTESKSYLVQWNAFCDTDRW